MIRHASALRTLLALAGPSIGSRSISPRRPRAAVFLIGDAGLPPERRVAWTTWNPFKPEDSLLPSGLLGPVTLQKQ